MGIVQTSESVNRGKVRNSLKNDDLILSVVIPTYNHADHLDRCLNSLFKQDIPLSNYEVIVVSDDIRVEPAKVLERYLKKYPNLQVIRNHERKGSDYARILGVKQAKTKWIVFTDDDCVFPHYWLRKIAQKFQKGKVLCIQGTQECRGKWGRFMQEGEEYLQRLKKRRALDTKNLAIRRDIILQYKFDEKMHAGGDYELGQRIFKKIEIVYDQSIYVFHVTDAFHVSFERGKRYGKTAAYICRKHGWAGINPKYKYPIILLFFFYLGSFFFFSLKFKSLRGGIAFFTVVMIAALSFRSNLHSSAPE